MLDDVGIPSSGSTDDATVLVSQDNGFVTIFRTLPSSAIGVAATRIGEKAERDGDGLAATGLGAGDSASAV